MDWTGPDDTTYDDLRAVYNGMIDSRPRLIASCATPSDVIGALTHARTEGLEVAVRSGGHSVAGASSVEDGLVIDVRPMKQIEIDPSRRTAKVGAGVTWGEFDAAAQQFGLATTGGRVSTTGVSGFTLGGGSGWLERQYGLACDNLIAVDLVTADGREVRADANHNPELFWALHGGGGNFGVATSFEFHLHQVGPNLMAGLMAWPLEQGADVGRAFLAWAESAPDALGTGLVALSGPPEEFIPPHLQGAPIIGVAALWSGDDAVADDVMATMRAQEPAVDLVGRMPYVAMQKMLDDPPGLRNYWSADFHDEFDEKALDVFLEYGHLRPSPRTQQILFPWGGAVAKLGAQTPMAQRDAAYVSHPFAVWEDESDDETALRWVREYRSAIAPFANGGTYLNFIGDEGEDRVRAAYGDKSYDRLAAVKAEYDPGNIFHRNQNVRPAG
ncbi:MAG: FAD-binding oxidoreductase [Nocardioidaceae bacterium]